ncbi:LysR family transcriptional regulator [Streptomyces sp. NPDC050529]|uniref:LysR family transcriptional regulator n=1 Tax=unclassified Streptomyces TaxID=2593676 RepID=UPI002DD9935A|nr:LysR family transcriptional regulator [Streptomyces sp. NBC_01022]MEE4492928.1 LysR family transcriptional regulator [Streptomyces sp. BE230]WRZ78896.1 LysR family transcriptional regulator [Streptomyces sp. NBC_01022]WRZ86783.1 LysR family transcriptional regulator [Streptomyces sp. NBC_01022]
MELQQMRYVIAVAETKNFTRAAEQCLVVQSALSHQIARLERELGARLFERTSRRVRLTAAGEAFLPAARQALDAADRARAEVAAAAGEIRGRLAVGAIPTVTAVDLPAALKRFHLRHQKVRISLRSGASEELVERVRQGTLDAAFLGLPLGPRPKGVRGRELGRGHLVAVVAPGHPLADLDQVDLARLADEPFVDFPAGTAGRAQSDDAFAQAGVRREVAFEVTAPDPMARLIRQGLGVGLLPAAYVAEFPDLPVVRLRDAPARVEHLVWSSLRPSPAAAAFLSLFGITAAESSGSPGA